jgi:hypothetical protein
MSACNPENLHLARFFIDLDFNCLSAERPTRRSYIRLRISGPGPLSLHFADAKNGSPFYESHS